MKVDPAVVHEKQRQALDKMIELYGDDSNAILNALHEMSARVAITCGVSPEDYAAGMKHHWDCLANVVNSHAEGPRTLMIARKLAPSMFLRRWICNWVCISKHKRGAGVVWFCRACGHTSRVRQCPAFRLAARAREG